MPGAVTQGYIGQIPVLQKYSTQQPGSNVFVLNKFIYLFIFGCVGSSLPHAGFLLLRRVRASLHCSAWASYGGGFSCCGARALGMWASVVVAHKLSSCGAQA